MISQHRSIRNAWRPPGSVQYPSHSAPLRSTTPQRRCSRQPYLRFHPLFEPFSLRPFNGLQDRRHHIVGTTLGHSTGRLLLRMHRFDGDCSPLQAEFADQLSHRRNLMASIRHLGLSQHLTRAMLQSRRQRATVFHAHLGAIADHLAVNGDRTPYPSELFACTHALTASSRNLGGICART